MAEETVSTVVPLQVAIENLRAEVAYLRGRLNVYEPPITHRVGVSDPAEGATAPLTSQQLHELAVQRAQSAEDQVRELRGQKDEANRIIAVLFFIAGFAIFMLVVALAVPGI